MVRKWMIVGLGLMMLSTTTLSFAEDFYATKNGKKYHKADCLLIKNKGAEKISLKDRQDRGLTPCQKCFKEPASQDSSKLNNQGMEGQEKREALNVKSKT